MSTAEILKTLAALAVGYLLGSLNTSVIVGKAYGKDIRQHGSHSGGLTNTLRVLGRSAAALVLAGDVAKGVVACLVGLAFGVYAHSGGAHGGGAGACVSELAAGAGAVLGHNWPVYFRFRGGKGMLTAAAVMFTIAWPMTLICLALFVAIVAATRYVSLATICAAVLFVGLTFVPAFEATAYFQAFAALLAVIIIFKHRANIQRLLAGAENRLSF